MDSPLRKESSAAEPSEKAEFEKTLSRSLHAPSDTALESEVEDDVIHVDNVGRRSSRIYGADYAESTEELERQLSRGGESRNKPITSCIDIKCSTTSSDSVLYPASSGWKHTTRRAGCCDD